MRPRRGLQARLLDEPDVIDAVPAGGRVRFVLVETQSGSARPCSQSPLEDITAVPAAQFEDGFMMLLRRPSGRRHSGKAMAIQRPHEPRISEPVVQVKGLSRQFGGFTAVDNVSLDISGGEVFGLLGPNGAGKTTMFRMLCGLLEVSSGTLQVAGVDLRRARASARQRIGYVAQKFSLYGQLSVLENLEFFASVYGLRGRLKRQRMDWALEQFELGSLARLPSGQLPGGYKQRLAMATAMLHEPEILFLDEPTSGADPLARREFWLRITALAEQGVTVIVTTHFMEEAEYCDRVAIMDAGRILAQGTPAEIRRRGHAIRPGTNHGGCLYRHRRAGSREPEHGSGISRSSGMIPPRSSPHMSARARARRTLAMVRKESYQVLRDPSSIAIGILLPVILILLLGYGLSLDVKNVPLALVLEDRSAETMELAASFRLSSWFDTQMANSMAVAQELILDRKVDGIIRVLPDFGRDLSLGRAQVQVVVHGTDANPADHPRLRSRGGSPMGRAAISERRESTAGLATVQSRLWFNEANESRWFLVPGLIVLIMTLIGSLLTALVMSREWERGTLESVFVTPVQVNEILLGKTVPYFLLGMIGLTLCIIAARFLFHVPLRGSIWVLGGASVLYLLVALGLGLLISAMAKNQFVASQVTMLLTFLPALMLSGFLFDLRSMSPAIRLITYAVPARYYVALLQTVFLAGDVWGIIVLNLLILGIMATMLLLLTRRVIRKRLA